MGINEAQNLFDNLENNELLVYKYIGLHLIEMSKKRINKIFILFFCMCSSYIRRHLIIYYIIKNIIVIIF